MNRFFPALMTRSYKEFGDVLPNRSQLLIDNQFLC
jgi:hypothetical protein